MGLNRLGIRSLKLIKIRYSRHLVVTWFIASIAFRLQVPLTRSKLVDSYIRDCLSIVVTSGSTVYRSQLLQTTESENREFDWDGIRILGKEPSLAKQLISEMMFIKRQHRDLIL